MHRKLVITLLIIIAWILLFTDYGKNIEESLFLGEGRVAKKNTELPSAGENAHKKNFEDFFPTQEGKIWRYKTVHSTHGNAKLTLTSLPKRELNQKQTTPFKFEFIANNGRVISYIVYVASEPDGIYQFAIERPIGSAIKTYPPIYYVRNPIKVGANWKNEVGSAIIKGVDEKVTVPAGTFIGCVEVMTTFSKQKKIEWFAPGVGSVKIYHNYPDSSHTLSQLESYE
jgi:hypothetical protein